MNDRYIDDGYTPRKHNVVRTLFIITLIIALIIGFFWMRSQLMNERSNYMSREANLEVYASNNYSITGELYAVKPDGTEVVEDINGKLWEIPGLKITRHDKLLLEIRDGHTVANVWVHSWAPTPLPSPSA